MPTLKCYHVAVARKPISPEIEYVYVHAESEDEALAYAMEDQEYTAERVLGLSVTQITSTTNCNTPTPKGVY